MHINIEPSVASIRRVRQELRGHRFVVSILLEFNLRVSELARSLRF